MPMELKEMKKEFIDFRVAKTKNETQWEGFLNNLFYRGLKGWLCWFTNDNYCFIFFLTNFSN